MYKHLLIATDGSDLASFAVKEGASLAHALGSHVTLLNVTLPFHVVTADPAMITDTEDDYREDMRRRAEQCLAAAASELEQNGVTCDRVHSVEEHPWEAILTTAKSRGCDLIVMASHGRGGLTTFLVGSQVSKVLAHSNIPVLVARPPA